MRIILFSYDLNHILMDDLPYNDNFPGYYGLSARFQFA